MSEIRKDILVNSIAESLKSKSEEYIASMMYDDIDMVRCDDCPAKIFCDSKRSESEDDGFLALPEGETCKTVLLEWMKGE